MQRDRAVRSQMKNNRSTVTVFRDSEVALREQYGNACLNTEEFQRKINRCSLTNCKGTCCYGGVRVDDATARDLQQLSTDRAAAFREIGLNLPSRVVVRTEWRGGVGNNTVFKTISFLSFVVEFSVSFLENTCNFFIHDGRSCFAN